MIISIIDCRGGIEVVFALHVGDWGLIPGHDRPESLKNR